MKWNIRFLQLAKEVSQWSKDPSSKVGAILVDTDNNVRTLGYNGFPRGIDDSDERLTNRDVKYQLTTHAEQNVISTCARLGIRTEDCCIVCTHFPCSKCAASIIQAGIRKVITEEPSEDFINRWKESIDLSAALFDEAGVELIVLKRG